MADITAFPVVTSEDGRSEVGTIYFSNMTGSEMRGFEELSNEQALNLGHMVGSLETSLSYGVIDIDEAGERLAKGVEFLGLHVADQVLLEDFELDEALAVPLEDLLALARVQQAPIGDVPTSFEGFGF